MSRSRKVPCSLTVLYPEDNVCVWGGGGGGEAGGAKKVDIDKAEVRLIFIKKGRKQVIGGHLGIQKGKRA